MGYQSLRYITLKIDQPGVIHAGIYNKRYYLEIYPPTALIKPVTLISYYEPLLFLCINIAVH